MMISAEEGKAIIVSLNRAAVDYDIKAKGASAARDTHNATLFAMYASQASALAVKIQLAGKVEIGSAADRDILVSALRHTAQFNWDLAAKERPGFEQDKRRQFSAAFGALADRIAEATKGKPPVLH